MPEALRPWVYGAMGLAALCVAASPGCPFPRENAYVYSYAYASKGAIYIHSPHAVTPWLPYFGRREGGAFWAWRGFQYYRRVEVGGAVAARILPAGASGAAAPVVLEQDLHRWPVFVVDQKGETARVWTW